MRIVCISDTHGRHGDITLPDGDMLLHAGDVSMRGKESEIQVFLDWFGKLDYKYKVFVAGNHDFFFEKTAEDRIRGMIPKGVVYLNDSGVTIEDISIWGSPIQPWFMDWAFNRQRGDEIKKHWDLIPPGTDILLTHGPPFGILDRIYTGLQVGCEELAAKLSGCKPRLHVFGHIHEAYGTEQSGDTLFVNASVLNRHYEPANAPFVFEWE